MPLDTAPPQGEDKCSSPFLFQRKKATEISAAEKHPKRRERER